MIRLLIAALCCGCLLTGCGDSNPAEEGVELLQHPTKSESEAGEDKKPESSTPPEHIAVVLKPITIDYDLPGNPSVMMWHDPTPLKVGNVRKVAVKISSYGDCEPITGWMTVNLPDEIKLIGEEGVDFRSYTSDMENKFIGTPPSPPPPQYVIRIPRSNEVRVQFEVLRQTEAANGLYEIKFRHYVQEIEPQAGPRIGVGARLVWHPKHPLYAPLTFESAGDE